MGIRKPEVEVGVGEAELLALHVFELGHAGILAGDHDRVIAGRAVGLDRGQDRIDRLRVVQIDLGIARGAEFGIVERAAEQALDDAVIVGGREERDLLEAEHFLADSRPSTGRCAGGRLRSRRRACRCGMSFGIFGLRGAGQSDERRPTPRSTFLSMTSLLNEPSSLAICSSSARCRGRWRPPAAQLRSLAGCSEPDGFGLAHRACTASQGWWR